MEYSTRNYCTSNRTIRIGSGNTDEFYIVGSVDIVNGLPDKEEIAYNGMLARGLITLLNSEERVISVFIDKSFDEFKIFSLLGLDIDDFNEITDLGQFGRYRVFDDSYAPESHQIEQDSYPKNARNI